MKRPEGITLIAIYFLVTGGLTLLGALFGVVFGDRGPCFLQNVCGIAQLLSLPFAFAALVSSGLLYGLVALGTAWGLLAMYGWARWSAIVLAALTLLSFPIGTVIGALVIWYLLRRDVVRLFE